MACVSVCPSQAIYEHIGELQLVLGYILFFINILTIHGVEDSRIIRSLEVEHKELHEQPYKGIKEGGNVGEAAKAVADILRPHLVKDIKPWSWKVSLLF